MEWHWDLILYPMKHIYAFFKNWYFVLFNKNMFSLLGKCIFNRPLFWPNWRKCPIHFGFPSSSTLTNSVLNMAKTFMKSHLSFLIHIHFDEKFYYILIYYWQEHVKSKTSWESIGVGKNKCDFKFCLTPLFDIAPSRLWECISNVSFLPKIDRTNFYSGGPTCIPNRHCAGGRKTSGKKLRHHFSLRKGKGSELHRKCMRKFCNVLQKSRDMKETCNLVFAMC